MYGTCQCSPVRSDTRIIFRSFGVAYPVLPLGCCILPHASWLLQVLVCGAELYTSNAALMPAAFYEKKISVQQVPSV